MKLFGRFNLKIFFLIFILLIAGFLRLWQLEKYPVGFTPDEASFGYDAYSIMQTGKDQWGHYLPITLESFGDFKSPLYAYLAIPSVALFGLNEFATRLPNALLGTGAVFVLYLLLGEMGKFLKMEGKRRVFLQTAGALLLSISPWHVMMSRGAFEANLITFFLPLGIYFFVKASKNPKYYLSGSVALGLNLFTYHSAKLITPFVFAFLVLIFRKNILGNLKRFLFPLAVFAMFFSVLLYSFRLGGGTRILERSVTQGALEEGAKIKIQLIQNGANPVLARLLHNKYQVAAQRFISNYSQYFSSDFLFIKGPAETTYGMIPGIGVLYIFEGLFILGLIPLLFIRKETRVLLALVALWLFIAPLPAALSTGVGYAANRAEAMIPVLQILAAFGLIGWSIFFEKLNRNVFLGISFIVAVAAFCNLSVVWKEYFVGSPAVAAPGMLFGRKEAIGYAHENESGYDTIIISRTLSEPQIFAAFYTKYDPRMLQDEADGWRVYREKNLSFLDQLGEYRLGKYMFKNIDEKESSNLQRVLMLGKPSDFSEGTVPLKEIRYPDGKPGIFIVKQ